MSRTVASEDALDAGDTVTDSFTYTVSDGTATDTANLVVTVTGVNDTPETDDASITTNGNTEVTLPASSFVFNDVDADDEMTAIKIVTLPGNGVLRQVTNSATSDLTSGQEYIFTKSQLEANELRFLPDSNEHGTPYASFDFQVYDGEDYSASATYTINVTSVNDPPTVTAQTIVNGTVTEFVNGDANEDTGTHTVNGSFEIDDVDSSNFMPCPMKALSNGPLKLAPSTALKRLALSRFRIKRLTAQAASNGPIPLPITLLPIR